MIRAPVLVVLGPMIRVSRGFIDVETVGLFKTRVSRDGAVEVWARGWRLESQVPVLIPALLAIAFWLAPFSVAVRAMGSVAMLVCAYGTFRLTRLGFRFDGRGVTVIDVIRTRALDWSRFAGIVGERNEHEGRCVVLSTDGGRIRSPGTLEPDQMDPFWAEGETSAVDQLNRLAGRLRAALAEDSEPILSIDVSAPDPSAGDLRHSPHDPNVGGSPGARRLRSSGQV